MQRNCSDIQATIKHARSGFCPLRSWGLHSSSILASTGLQLVIDILMFKCQALFLDDHNIPDEQRSLQHMPPNKTNHYHHWRILSTNQHILKLLIQKLFTGIKLPYKYLLFQVIHVELRVWPGEMAAATTTTTTTTPPAPLFLSCSKPCVQLQKWNMNYNMNISYTEALCMQAYMYTPTAEIQHFNVT